MRIIRTITQHIFIAGTSKCKGEYLKKCDTRANEGKHVKMSLRAHTYMWKVSKRNECL